MVHILMRLTRNQLFLGGGLSIKSLMVKIVSLVVILLVLIEKMVPFWIFHRFFLNNKSISGQWIAKYFILFYSNIHVSLKRCQSSMGVLCIFFCQFFWQGQSTTKSFKKRPWWWINMPVNLKWKKENNHLIR